VKLTREPAGQQWRARQREILNRIVRETDPPTDAMPRMTNSPRTDVDEAYQQRVGEVLDLAGSIGAILMASGTPTMATMEQVRAITAAYGVERCEVDVISTTIHVTAYRGPTSPAASTLHVVQSRSIDFSRLAAVDRLVARIRAGQVSPTNARDELDAIITAPHPYKRWVATLAWGALAFATAGTLGASLLACLVSALSAMTIDRVNRRLNKQGLPFFFQYAVGGAIATAPPLVLYWLGPKLGLHFEPTVAIAAGLVVLLAGLSLVSSVGDVISGAPVTAAGRFFELVMMTGATIAGVALVLHLANRFGAPFVAIGATAPPALAELPARRRRRSRRRLRAGLLRRTDRSGGSGIRRCGRHHRLSVGAGLGSGCRRRVVRRRGADRLGRPAHGTPQSRATHGRVDRGHRAPATGSCAAARDLRDSQRSARRRVRCGIGRVRGWDCARGRCDVGRMELVEGTAAPNPDSSPQPWNTKCRARAGSLGSVQLDKCCGTFHRAELPSAVPEQLEMLVVMTVDRAAMGNADEHRLG
jgi:uncharacterized membrane protein YjjP (DUF1212 family)